MSKAENLILQLTSRALFNAPVDFNPAAVDWTSIYKEASSQALTILIWDTLSDEERAAVPENIAAIWEQDTMMHVLRNEQLLYEQKEVVHMLSEAGIPCAILKGSSSAAWLSRSGAPHYGRHRYIRKTRAAESCCGYFTGERLWRGKRGESYMPYSCR